MPNEKVMPCITLYPPHNNPIVFYDCNIEDTISPEITFTGLPSGKVVDKGGNRLEQIQVRVTTNLGYIIATPKDNPKVIEGQITTGIGQLCDPVSSLPDAQDVG